MAIVVAVVVVVIIVGAILATAFITGVQQASNLSRPNINVTNLYSWYSEDCGVYGTQTTTWHFSATLVNTGGAGYADIGYDVNEQQVTTNTYYVASNYQLPVSTGVTVNACYGSTTPTYNVVLLSQRPA